MLPTAQPEVAAPPADAAPQEGGAAAPPAGEAAEPHAGGIIDEALSNPENVLWALGVALLAVVVGLLLHRIILIVARHAAGRTPFGLDNVLVRRLNRPAMLVFPLVALQFALPKVGRLAPGLVELILHATSIAMIAAVAWLLAGGVRAAQEMVNLRHDVAVADNLEARRVHTQLEVIARALIFFIGVIAAAAILMTFPRVQQFGTSILASAGLAGLVLGLAARPALENLIAGLQIALTQPIRLDDVVIIEGEWGRVEEIASTYVVVRIWDQRRLIVPFSRIISEPFQNWTRTRADILGTVYLYCDYTVPVGAVRERVEGFVKDHPKWDGRVAGLVVTDAKERTLELRALVSARDSSDAWDLRCDLREHLVDFLQREHPNSLPRVRADVESEPDDRAERRAISRPRGERADDGAERS